MKAFARGGAALLILAAAGIGLAAAQDTNGQAPMDNQNKATSSQADSALSSERGKVSYAIGMDIGNSLKPVGPDLDLAAFEHAIRNTFDGGAPSLSEDEARATDAALRARMAARAGQSAPGTAPGSEPPAVDKAKVGALVGGLMVGRSLTPIKDQIDLPVVVRAVRDTLQGRTPALDPEAAKAVLADFSQRMQARMQADAKAAGSRNQAEGEAFLARNKQVKGVFTTQSGLQYMVLRQGSGPHPAPSDRVRVNYEGSLLDGTVFDSSYKRNEPAEFGLDEVIPGWTEGVGLMPVGAKYRFWIPGNLAYGAKGTPGGPIGPNATLVFDVELMAIVQ